MKTVLIFESSLAGHRGHYVGSAIDVFRQQNRRLVVTLPHDAEKAQEFAEILRRKDAIGVLDLSIPWHPASGWKSPWIRFRSLCTTVKRHRPDAVFIPSGDVLAYFLPLAWVFCPGLARANVVIGLHRLKFGYPLKGWKDSLVRMFCWIALAISPVSAYLSVDEIPIEVENRRRFFRLARLHWMPDPLTPTLKVGKVRARQILGLPEGVLLVGMIGILDERKGAQYLALQVPALVEKFGASVVLAGKQSLAVHQKFAAVRGCYKASDFVELDRYLSSEELLLCFEALDLICLFQANHIGISSMVLRAAQANVPVLTADFGWSGHIVRENELGWVVNATDAAAVEAALRSALSAIKHGMLRLAGNDFAKKNTVERFSDTVGEVFRKLLN